MLPIHPVASWWAYLKFACLENLVESFPIRKIWHERLLQRKFSLERHIGYRRHIIMRKTGLLTIQWLCLFYCTNSAIWGCCSVRNYSATADSQELKQEYWDLWSTKWLTRSLFNFFSKKRMIFRMQVYVRLGCILDTFSYRGGSKTYKWTKWVIFY